MHRKTIVLTGPPSPHTVNESSCSVVAFEQPFQDLFHLQTHISEINPRLSQTQYAAWRLLPLKREPFHDGLSQVHDVQYEVIGSGTFFTTADATPNEDTSLSGDDGDERHDILTHFLEQSLAVHTSTFLEDDEDDSANTTETTSFATTPHQAQQPRALSIPSHLSDLEDIPPAAHITSLHPQTITINTITGVLSVAQPRTVTTRWGTTLSLIEVLLGDETATGFGVTFWLPREKDAENDIVKLRRQDVVLMENVGLHVFRGRVYGQSLRKGLTRVHLLWRADGSGYYSSSRLSIEQGQSPQVVKTRRVRDWVLRFVDLEGARKGTVSWDRPPDDTQ